MLFLGSLFLSIIVHELYHAFFYEQVHFIGFDFSDERIAFVRGIKSDNSLNNETMAKIVELITLATTWIGSIVILRKVEK